MNITDGKSDNKDMKNIKIKVIRTKEDYEVALKNIEILMDRDPEPNSDEDEQINVLALLIEEYETKMFPLSHSDPITAIKFRMEQANLIQADLIPYIGSRSRVSEILSGKRPLTLEMVRKLSVGLGIPSESLIQKPEFTDTEVVQPRYFDTGLVREMETKGYFGNSTLKEYGKEYLLKDFFSEAVPISQVSGALRRSYRIGKITDKNALYAWSTRILKRAEKEKPSVVYKDGAVTLEYMQKLAKLSIKEDGPLHVQKNLKNVGITLIIEPHLSKTYLDGAVLMTDKVNPVIGLTLRHDRLDNFWFALMHELAHIAEHYGKGITIFYDEHLDDMKECSSDNQNEEDEADRLAREALVPLDRWEISPAKIIPSAMAAESLANELGIHTAIVAGFMRHERKIWYYLKDIVNNARVRYMFTDIPWKKR